MQVHPRLTGLLRKCLTEFFRSGIPNLQALPQSLSSWLQESQTGLTIEDAQQQVESFAEGVLEWNKQWPDQSTQIESILDG